MGLPLGGLLGGLVIAAVLVQTVILAVAVAHVAHVAHAHLAHLIHVLAWELVMYIVILLLVAINLPLSLVEVLIV